MSEYLLKVTGLEKSYGALKATSNLDLKIKNGDIHALIGPNGAGKTTLVNQLTGDILSDSGQILFDDINITRLKHYKRARLGITRSFQITHIFEKLTVAENMALSICAHNGHNFHFWQNSMKSKVVKEKLDYALDRVGLISRSSLQASYLSHGEKRQLEVGMAITSKSRLLILDEPMAGMGPGGTVELAKLIKSLREEMTILLVEHDMDVVFSLADMVTVLVYGEVVITGSPDEVKRDPRVRAAYLGEES